MNNKMKKILSNKRGEVPTFILVIGVLAICILTLFSFISFNIGRETNQIGLGLFEKIYSDAESFDFYINAGFTNEETLEKMKRDESHDLRRGYFRADIEEGNLVIMRRDQSIDMNVTYFKDI